MQSLDGNGPTAWLELQKPAHLTILNLRSHRSPRPIDACAEKHLQGFEIAWRLSWKRSRHRFYLFKPLRAKWEARKEMVPAHIPITGLHRTWLQKSVLTNKS